MNTFLLCAAILFFALGIVWRNSNWINVLLRIAFFGMAFWGLVLWLIGQGYMFKEISCCG